MMTNLEPQAYDQLTTIVSLLAPLNLQPLYIWKY